MILDKPRNIGQLNGESACKMMIAKPAPVAQGIERSPPKLTAERWQVAARASNPVSESSNKPGPSCAKQAGDARAFARILDSY